MMLMVMIGGCYKRAIRITRLNVVKVELCSDRKVGSVSLSGEERMA